MGSMAKLYVAPLCHVLLKVAKQGFLEDIILNIFPFVDELKDFGGD